MYRARVRRPDPIFAEPRLASIYDWFDDDRSDLPHYVLLTDEFGAKRVLDVGCGTGTLAVMLADRGCTVVGVDPADASLAVARQRPGAERVRWLRGDATQLPPLAVDLALMTGNVAQVFLDDDAWAATLTGIRRALCPDGRLVFESRDPARGAWLDWNREQSFRSIAIPDLGVVDGWVDVLDVQPGLVSFRWTYLFHADGACLTSDSTLRFRSRDELAASLQMSGFAVEEVRDAPDRPGLEFVFVSRPSS